ncbi:MAG TPA: hypothetical protein VIW26_05130 [Gemmatimonadales bacterium]
MPAIEDLVTEPAGLPGIERKTAQRLTFYPLKESNDTALRLAEAIRRMTGHVRRRGHDRAGARGTARHDRDRLSEVPG